MRLIIINIAFLIILIGCRKTEQEPEYQVPKINIYNPIVINYDTTLTGGEIRGDGISSYGICYSSQPSPTINDKIIYGIKNYNFTYDGTHEGVTFNCDLTQLQPNIKYYIRAFATQGSVVSYSYEYKFTNTPEMISIEGSNSFKYPFQTSPEIEISNFYMSRYEITNESYCQFINGNKFRWGQSWRNGKVLPAIAVIIMNNPDSKILYNIEEESFSVEQGYENHPVIFLRWGDAVMYAEMSRCRLPTDAEWQFAAKGGNLSSGYIYSGGNNLDEVAWHQGNSNLVTHEVGKKKSNEIGLFDMTGNASEWCQDYYSSQFWHYNSRPKKNPCMIFSIDYTVTGDYVYRGGSSINYDWECEIDQRKTPDPCLKGFRLVYSKAKLNYY